MFGTLEGVITPFYDMKIVPWRKEIMTGRCLGLKSCMFSVQNVCLKHGISLVAKNLFCHILFISVHVMRYRML